MCRPQMSVIELVPSDLAAPQLGQQDSVEKKTVLGIEIWREDYNCSRPHESLGNVPPIEYINPFP